MTMNENDKQAEPVAQPYAYVYEFDSGMFGIHRSFSSNERNGSKPSRVVPVYTHPAPAFAQEPVVHALRFSDDCRLCLSCVFDTLQEAQDYANSCESKPVVVRLYTEAPAVAQPAVAVNEKLKMALMMFLCAHDHPNPNTTREAVRCANEALGLIETVALNDSFPVLPQPTVKGEAICCGNITTGGEYMGQKETICCGQFEQSTPDYYTAGQMYQYAMAAYCFGKKGGV